MKSSKPYAFRVIIEPEETSGFHGFAPLLRGVHTYGKTIQETKKNLEEAVLCHLQGMIKDKEKIPRESDVFESVQMFSEKDLVSAR